MGKARLLWEKRMNRAQVRINKLQADMKREEAFWEAQTKLEQEDKILEYHKRHLQYLKEYVERTGVCSDYRRLVMRAIEKTIKLLDNKEKE